MYKEIVGTTAVRKSSKIKDISDEFNQRITGKFNRPSDYVNYTYFLTRLNEFEIGSRITSQEKIELVHRGTDLVINSINTMDFGEVLRYFADAS